ncbi:GAF domain-containing sensor histidine kinase [Actinomycetospora lemnae]|uniref:Oxygen sensor histidine kinase NreB n=1 Tax=Actinomycetospora lemnae TaxID=3019891 RepID=A0ABT5SR32_9PSEU|nr:ATP-binding protein [Actinomycetospora sp. DW7H6]MDD7965310.1 histidine kinase [Actinomycetospora sp. DW7H6]
MCYSVKSIEDVRRLVVATRGLAGLAGAPALVATACRRLADLVDTDVVAVALLDGDDTLVVGASAGPVPLEGLRLPRGPGLGWRALRRAMVTTTGDCAADPDADALARAVAADGVRGLGAVPVTWGGNWLGVLYAGRRGGRVSPHTTLLVNEFAASLAPLLVNAVRAEQAGRIAVAEERRRIAQELHDTAGQLLFRISMSAKEIQQGAADTAGTVAAARSIELVAAEASGYLRRAMHSLLPADDALPVTLRRDVAAFAARAGITAELVTLGEPAPAPPEVEGLLVAVLREALHNVEKHAGAGAVLVSLAYRPRAVSLAVEDDGKGLPDDLALHPVARRGSGLGIPGLLQRVAGVGGELTVTGNDDGGTSLRATVPTGRTS